MQDVDGTVSSVARSVLVSTSKTSRKRQLTRETRVLCLSTADIGPKPVLMHLRGENVSGGKMHRFKNVNGTLVCLLTS